MVKTVRGGHFIIRPSAVIGLSPVQTHSKITDKILSVIRGDVQEFDSSWVLQPTYIGHLSQVISQILAKNWWNDEVNIFTDYPITQFQIASDILKHFDVSAKTLNTGRVVPLMKIDDEKMKTFELKPSTYQEIIDQIVVELRNPERFFIK